MLVLYAARAHSNIIQYNVVRPRKHSVWNQFKKCTRADADESVPKMRLLRARIPVLLILIVVLSSVITLLVVLRRADNTRTPEEFELTLLRKTSLDKVS